MRVWQRPLSLLYSYPKGSRDHQTGQKWQAKLAVWLANVAAKRGRDGKMWQTGRIGKIGRIGRPDCGSVIKTIAVRQKIGRQHRFVAEWQSGREEGTGRQITLPPNAADKIGRHADEIELAARQHCRSDSTRRAGRTGTGHSQRRTRTMMT